jgi:uncharacterized DUF497 family protein
MDPQFDPDKDAANIVKHGLSLDGERLISVRRATAKERKYYEG